MMQINNLYLDLLPAYIPFTVQCTDAAGAKTNPTVDALTIYEEDGADATFSNTQITGSPFDPAQINSKTGLWGVLVAKTALTAGKYYIALWEMTVDGTTTAKVEVYYVCNSSSFKADVTNLDVTVSSRSSHSAASVWAAAGRELSTPANYKADVSALAIEANVQGHAAAALTAYDPPTRAEATADKVEIEAMIQYTNGKKNFSIAAAAVPARNVQIGMLDYVDIWINATQKLRVLMHYNTNRQVTDTSYTVV